MLNKLIPPKNKNELIRNINNSKLSKFIIIEDFNMSKLNIIRRDFNKLIPSNNKGRIELIMMKFDD